MSQNTKGTLEALSTILNEVVQFPASDWEQLRTKAEVAILLSNQIQEIEPEEVEVIAVQEKPTRRQNLREQNMDFWKGFISYAFSNEQFSLAFSFRKPKPVEWLRFYFSEDPRYCINAGYNRKEQQITAKFDILDDYNLYSVLSKDFVFSAETTYKGEVYSVKMSKDVEEDSDVEEIYNQLMELMLTLESQILEKINAMDVAY